MRFVTNTTTFTAPTFTILCHDLYQRPMSAEQRELIGHRAQDKGLYLSEYNADCGSTTLSIYLLPTALYQPPTPEFSAAGAEQVLCWLPAKASGSPASTVIGSKEQSVSPCIKSYKYDGIALRLYLYMLGLSLQPPKVAK